MSNPTAAMLVIGDEILSGRTRDTNTGYLAAELTKHGIALKEARVVSDDAEAIIEAVQALSTRYDNVFTSGGIGPTHDDITAQAVAAAFDTPIGIRQDAYDLLAAFYAESGREFNDARQRMARIPDGAALIDNPVSIAPGFTIKNVHVCAGVPQVFQAMVAAILPGLTTGAPVLSQSLRIDRGEGDVAGPLADLAADFPQISIGSYPFNHGGAFGTNIVVRGTDAGSVDRAMTRLASLFPQGDT